MSDRNRGIDIRLIEEALEVASKRKFFVYYPDSGPLARHRYPKHMEFFRLGKVARERLFMAGNRVGKTEGVGAYEVTCHLTGLYPHWWEGRVFDRPVRAVVAGQTAVSTREVVQSKLLGKVVRGPDGNLTADGGIIPPELIHSIRPRSGVPGAVDVVHVRHKTGGLSSVVFKSYEQGPGSFAGTEQDIVWFDEEPPLDVYSEALMRTMAAGSFGGGIVLVTFTPLLGYTDVVARFLESQDPGIRWVRATWDDAPHLSEQEKADMIEKLPPHQRVCRMMGEPVLGVGLVYPIDLATCVVEPFDIPPSWPRGFGLDVGWNATAAVWVAYDSANDVAYVYDEYLGTRETPAVHARAILARGERIPGVIDPAARGRSQADGMRLIDLYRAAGLQVEPADSAVDAGIFEVWNRLSTGRLKFFSHVRMTLKQMSVYHRDEKGKIIKRDDHLLDAMRYRIMHLGQMRPVIPDKKPEIIPSAELLAIGRGPLTWMY